MPWGVSRDEIDHVLRRWSPRVERVRAVPYGRWRGIGACALRTFGGVPRLRNLLPLIVHVQTAAQEA